MTWLEAPDYWLARLVIERGLGAIYGIAFLVVLKQFAPLLGERGLLPVPRFVAYVPFRASPSLFHFRYSDRLLSAAAWTGLALSLLVVAGILLLLLAACGLVAANRFQKGGPPVPEQAITEAKLTTEALKADEPSA